MNANGRPRRIGPYLVKGKLADGGMGEIYLASRVAAGGFHEECALKMVRPSLAKDPRYAELFLREARLSARLEHRNIVRIFAFDREPDGALYMAMEYVDGRDLAAILRRAAAAGRRMPVDTALRIAIEALQGLQYAHERRDDDGLPLGIVHRDLTPNNILVSLEGEVKIADFGVAKTVRSDSTNPRELKGKFHYLSPEQIDAEPLDARSDLFTLGVVLYEMIAGERPFEGDSVSALLSRILRCEHQPLSARRDAPVEVDRVIAQSLCRLADGRFASAAQMRAALEQALAAIDGPPTSIRDFCRSLYQGAAAVFLEERTDGGDGDEATGVGLIAREARGAAPDAPAAPRSKWTVGAALGLAAAVALALIIGYAMFPAPPAAPTPSAATAPVESAAPADASAAEREEPPPPETAKAEAAPAKRPEPPAAPPVAALTTPTPAPAGYLAVGDLAPFAHVYVNGQYKDDTPTKMISLPPGAYSVRLYNPSVAKSASITVQIESGKVAPIPAWP